MDPITKVKWNDVEYDCSLTITACDEIEEFFQTNIDRLYLQIVQEMFYQRKLMAFVIFKGLSFAGVPSLDYADVRDFFHHKSMGEYSDYINAVSEMLLNAIHDPNLEKDEDADDIIEGE